MSPSPDPMGSIKISKNAYTFNLRRRFTPVSHFAVKKSKDDSPLGRAIESMRNPEKKPFGTPGAGTGGGAGGAGKGAGSGAPSGGMKSILGAMLKTTLVIVFLLALAILWVYMTVNAAPITPAVPPVPHPQFIGSLDIQPLTITMLTAGTRSAVSSQPYVQFDYTPHNLSNLSLDLRMYSSQPSRQVFVLRYPRRGDDIWPEFYSSLQGDLHRQGWLVNEIDLEDLGTMPGGSTLVIPTGFLPAPLLAGDTGRRIPAIDELAGRGVNVIFIGRPLDNVLDEGGSAGTPRAADAYALARLGIEFNLLTPPATLPPFHMIAPLYSVKSSLHPATPYYGSVQAMSIGSGFLIFVPQTLDGGWPKNGAAAGEDIARLIADEPYRPVISSTQWVAGSGLNQTGRASLFLDTPVQTQNGILRARYYLTDTNGLTEQLVIDWPIQKQARGDLFLYQPTLIPVYLGGGLTSIELQPHEPDGKSVKLFLELEQNGQTYSRTPVEDGATSTNVPTTATFSTDAPTGTYVLRLVDSFNKVYAATRVYVPNLAVSIATDPKTKAPIPTRTMFGTGQFQFAFTVDGSLSSVPAVSVQLISPPSPIKGPLVSFTNTPNVTYDFKRDFNRGNYTWRFDFGNGYTQDITLEFATRVQFWEKPEIMAMGIFGLLVFGFGFYMSKLRSDKILFSLDIPDFPPQSVNKISLPATAVLGLFDTINRDYAWEKMPLKAEELKGGFRKIMSGGKQVMIGDYNLERLLERLRAKRLVEESGGYWMPTSWTRGAGASPARRLATYRYLRDMFVTHAVRFSKLRAVADCDVKTIIGSTEYYIHFYEGSDDVILRALATVERGRTWILFADRYELERFEDRLHSAAKAPLALKMQLANKRARLFCLDELPRILKNLKVEPGS